MQSLVVAGNVNLEQVKHLAEKWFGDIPSGNKYVRSIHAGTTTIAGAKTGSQFQSSA
jgi:predicted Zn-dependent peptidase